MASGRSIEKLLLALDREIQGHGVEESGMPAHLGFDAKFYGRRELPLTEAVIGRHASRMDSDCDPSIAEGCDLDWESILMEVGADDDLADYVRQRLVGPGFGTEKARKRFHRIKPKLRAAVSRELDRQHFPASAESHRRYLKTHCLS